MIDWKKVAQGAGTLIEEAGKATTLATGNPTAETIAVVAAELGEFALQAVEDGLTTEAIIQQLQDRHFDLLNRLKG